MIHSAWRRSSYFNMPRRDAVLCRDCSLLFNPKERVDPDDAYSQSAYIPIPHSHQLHRLLSSTGPDLGVGSANDCHFCSLLLRLRSSSKALRNNGPSSVSGSRTHEYFLDIFSYGRDDGHSSHRMNIVGGRGLRDRPPFKYNQLLLFQPTGKPIIANLHFTLL